MGEETKLNMSRSMGFKNTKRWRFQVFTFQVSAFFVITQSQENLTTVALHTPHNRGYVLEISGGVVFGCLNVVFGCFNDWRVGMLCGQGLVILDILK